MGVRIFSLKKLSEKEILKSTWVFQHPKWLIETPEGEDIRIALYEDTEKSWALPFYFETWAGIRILRCAGGRGADYHGLWTNGVPPTQKEWSKVFSAIDKYQRFHVFFMERTSEHWGLGHWNFWESSHQLSLTDSFEKLYAAKIPGKIRSDTARQTRRLQDIGNLHFEVATTAEQALALLNKTIELKETQYERLHVPSIFADPFYKKFYQNLSVKYHTYPNAPKKFLVHISALKCNEEILSTHWGLCDEQRFYYMFPAYSQGSFSKFSPGRLHLLELIKWSQQQGLTVFDFTVGDEGYKAYWCDITTPLYQVYKVQSILGWIFILKEKVRTHLKTVRFLNSWILAVKAQLKKAR